MPDSEIRVGGDFSGFIQEADVAKAHIQELKNEIVGLAGVLGNGTATNQQRGQFFDSLNELRGLQSAQAAMQSTAASGRPVMPADLENAAASASIFSGAVRYREADPFAISSELQSAGVGSGTIDSITDSLQWGEDSVRVPTLGGRSSRGVRGVLAEARARQQSDSLFYQTRDELADRAEDFGVRAIGYSGFYSEQADNLDSGRPVHSRPMPDDEQFIARMDSQLSAFGNLQSEMDAYHAKAERTLGYTRVGAAELAMRTVGQIAQANAQQTISGEPDPMAFGSAYGGFGGGIAGLMIGAGLGSVIPGIGTAIGALGGLTAGSAMGSGLTDAALAPGAARTNMTRDMAEASVLTGEDAYALAGGAEDASRLINDAFSSSRLYDQGLRGVWQNFKATFGMNEHPDKTSFQIVGRAEGSLISGYAASGRALSSAEAQAIVEDMALSSKNGVNVDARAALIAKAEAAYTSSGGNLIDIADKAGIPAASAFLDFEERGSERSGFLAAEKRIQSAEYAGNIAQSSTQAAAAGYEASAFTGRSAGQRAGDFNAVISDLQAQAGTVSQELDAFGSVKGGADSSKASALRAVREGLYREIAEAENQRSTLGLSEIQSGSALALAGAQLGLTRASLYGAPGDFAPAGAAIDRDLGAEANQIRTVLSTPNNGLTRQQTDEAKTRLRQIDAQRLSLPSEMAGAAMRRDYLGIDTEASEASAGYTAASLYGSDQDLGAAALGEYASQQDVISASDRALAAPLSAADRAAALQRKAGAAANLARIQAGSRDTLLGRISGRAAVAETAADAGSSAASLYGTDADVASAGEAALYSRQSEAAGHMDQLLQGGLTEEQERRIQLRLAQLPGESAQISASSRDVLLSRNSARNAIAETAADAGLRRAALIGDAGDLLAAENTSVKALQAESASLTSQLTQGGLTEEQESRIKLRLAAIPGDMLGVAEGNRETVYRKEDAGGFSLRDVQISGELERRNLLPYAPGPILGLEAERIQNSQQQLGVLDAREQEMRSAGVLSPERALALEQERQGLLTSTAEAEAHITSGIESRFPAEFAGMPAAFRRFSSASLTARALEEAGIPYRDFGAGSGDQLAAEQRFYGGLGVGEPYSRASTLQPGGAGDLPPGREAPHSSGGGTGAAGATADILGGSPAGPAYGGAGDPAVVGLLSQAVSILAQIASAMHGGGGPVQGGKWSDGLGNTFGNLQTRDMDSHLSTQYNRR
jgi:hypothetical protein